MMFLHPHDELHKQQQLKQDGFEHHYQHHQQQVPSYLQGTYPQQQLALNESDEDAALASTASGGDNQSQHSTVVDYAESDLRDADADTKMLIAHLSDLDVREINFASQEKKRVGLCFAHSTVWSCA